MQSKDLKGSMWDKAGHVSAAEYNESLAPSRRVVEDVEDYYNRKGGSVVEEVEKFYDSGRQRTAEEPNAQVCMHISRMYSAMDSCTMRFHFIAIMLGKLFLLHNVQTCSYGDWLCRAAAWITRRMRITEMEGNTWGTAMISNRMQSTLGTSALRLLRQMATGLSRAMKSRTGGVAGGISNIC